MRLFGNMACQPLFLEWVNGWLLHGIKYKCIEFHISLYALFEQFKHYSPILICVMPSAYLLLRCYPVTINAEKVGC